MSSSMTLRHQDIGDLILFILQINDTSFDYDKTKKAVLKIMIDNAKEGFIEHEDYPDGAFNLVVVLRKVRQLKEKEGLIWKELLMWTIIGFIMWKHMQ